MTFISLKHDFSHRNPSKNLASNLLKKNRPNQDTNFPGKTRNNLKFEKESCVPYIFNIKMK